MKFELLKKKKNKKNKKNNRAKKLTEVVFDFDLLNSVPPVFVCIPLQARAKSDHKSKILLSKELTS